MQKSRYSVLGLQAALWKIRNQSPFCFVPQQMEAGTEWETRAITPQWRPAEAGVAWAIWERAVLDSYGYTSPNPAKNAMSEEDMRQAEYTAETGCIASGGDWKYDLLSALGIDLEWAQNTLQRVTWQFDRMIDSGWTPNAG